MSLESVSLVESVLEQVCEQRLVFGPSHQVVVGIRWRQDPQLILCLVKLPPSSATVTITVILSV